MNNFTKTPNYIFDSISSMSESELRVTMALVRATFGYHKDTCKMTFDDIQRCTGLSRGGVSSGVKAVKERGFFLASRSTWKVNEPQEVDIKTVYPVDRKGGDTVYSVDQNSLLSRPKQSTQWTKNSLLSRPSTSESNKGKENYKENYKESPPNPPLKFPREQLVQEFNGHLKHIWPVAEALQEVCDIPRFDTFKESIWEAIGYDGLTVEDIKRIAKKLRQQNPRDSVWPSNVLNTWRREWHDKAQKPRPAANVSRGKLPHELAQVTT